jgi:hypothetical protein
MYMMGEGRAKAIRSDGWCSLLSLSVDNFLEKFTQAFRRRHVVDQRQ